MNSLTTKLFKKSFLYGFVILGLYAYSAGNYVNCKSKNQSLSLNHLSVSSWKKKSFFTNLNSITRSSIDHKFYLPTPPPSNEWLGTNSTNWEDAGNWSLNTIPGNFENIIISSSAVNDLVISGPRTINSITFNGAGMKIIILTADLTVQQEIYGADASNYIKFSGVGNLFMSIPNGSTKAFAVGRSTYNPISITNNTGSTDDFGVIVSDSVLIGGSSGSIITTTMVNRTWHIQNNVGTPNAGVDFIFNWNTGDVVNGTLSNPKMNHHNGSNWEIPTVASETAGANSLTITGYTGSFSPFAIGEGTSPMPVEMISFTSDCTEEGNLLNWQTASEKNSAYFEVEKSADLDAWVALNAIPAAGNSSSLQSYAYLDQNKSNRTLNYYRLIQYDLNGQKSTYGPITTSCSKADEFKITVLPNPNNGQFQLSIDSEIGQEGEIFIIASDGKIIHQEKIMLVTGNTLKYIPLKNSEAGLYHLKIKTGNGISTQLISVN